MRRSVVSVHAAAAMALVAAQVASPAAKPADDEGKPLPPDDWAKRERHKRAVEDRMAAPSKARGPRVPTTPADHERIRLAQERQARKAARQAKGMRADV